MLNGKTGFRLRSKEILRGAPFWGKAGGSTGQGAPTETGPELRGRFWINLYKQVVKKTGSNNSVSWRN
jgi:hypothetical protein